MTIEFSPHGKDRWTSLTLPLDPDTPFSVIPLLSLKRSGIQPQMFTEVRIAGTIVDRNLGTAFFRYRGRWVESRVVFPHPDDPCRWGWHAAYFLGWEVDPKTGRLKKANLDRPSPFDER